ncbi:MAG: hypothetical protein Q9226_002035 [Calogaya cf. arnoldii]
MSGPGVWAVQNGSGVRVPPRNPYAPTGGFSWNMPRAGTRGFPWRISSVVACGKGTRKLEAVAAERKRTAERYQCVDAAGIGGYPLRNPSPPTAGFYWNMPVRGRISSVVACGEATPKSEPVAGRRKRESGAVASASDSIQEPVRETRRTKVDEGG